MGAGGGVEGVGEEDQSGGGLGRRGTQQIHPPT